MPTPPCDTNTPCATPPAYDVFNGDADGICALHQLRLAFPLEATLITGVKRDIGLLERVPFRAGIDVTVLDVSLDVNAAALRRLVDAGARVAYFDHHSAQQAFAHPLLQLFLDESPSVCTSMLVDRYLQGRYRQWAVVAAFGDNLPTVGRALARQCGLTDDQIDALEKLGVLLNYNAYGECITDLHVAPECLYRALHQFADPAGFIDAAPEYRLLSDGYRADAGHMDDLQPAWQAGCGAIYVLPDQPWAHRTSGVFANRLVGAAQDRSYAVLSAQANGGYLVSVRSGAPDLRPANAFCGRFPSGGGRRAAGGINHLPVGELERFIGNFADYFSYKDSAATVLDRAAC